MMADGQRIPLEWNSAMAYAEGDIVTYQGRYVRIGKHYATGVPPDIYDKVSLAPGAINFFADDKREHG